MRKIFLMIFFIIMGFVAGAFDYGPSYFRTHDTAYSGRQLLPAGHWVYDAMAKLYSENHMCCLADNAPISVGQLRNFFSRLDYSKMSESGKSLYLDVYEYLFRERKGVLSGKYGFSKAFFGFNVILTPQFLVKTNDDLDWSFSTDYTGHKVGECYEYSGSATAGTSLEYPLNSAVLTKKADCYKTHDSKGDYCYEGNFSTSSINKQVANVPIYLGWGDIFMIESDLEFGTSCWGYSRDWNFVNIPENKDYMDFYTPHTAYGSVGYDWKNWGFQFSAGRTGLQVGRTLTGSVIYNASFDTQFYAQFNIYCQYMLYNMDVVQIEKNRFLFLHQVEITPWKWFKLGVMEGTLINEPFEVRFLNPLMIMHSFGAWEEYSDSKEKDIYGESHVCAYLAALMDIVPCNGLRIYALYAQNEMQAPWELGSASSKAIPDGFGWQVGFEVNIPFKGDYFTVGAEGVYTTPFLYLKQGADWCLVSRRTDFEKNTDVPLYSWIGTPFGPDAIGFQAKLKYEHKRKWGANLSYLFVAHGTNSFGMFDAYYTDVDGRKFSAYYPSVLRHIGVYDDDKAEDVARDKGLTGTIMYTNNITLNGYYAFNNHFKIEGQASCVFVFNNQNIGGNTDAGVELSVSLRYNLF